jgi:hypothetical protein
MLAVAKTPTRSQTIHKSPIKQRLDPAEMAESHLRSNSYLALKNVSCEYQEGVLVLKGYLPTYYLKQIAQAVVAPTEGVERIVNQIEVVAQRS